jgi:hypothetical protein
MSQYADTAGNMPGPSGSIEYIPLGAVGRFRWISAQLAAGRHIPLAQTPLLQMVPHDPQLFGSLANVTSQPFPAFMSQLPKPLEHAPIVHAPVMHIAAAFGNEQRMPHPPQLFTSFVM